MTLRSRLAPATLCGLAVLALAGCGLKGSKETPPTVSGPRVVIGQPYQVDGQWRYPRQSFDYNETGLAVAMDRPSGLTANGEAADAAAMAAAHPTLQLPCIVRVTNLDTGLQLVLRVNDRGLRPRGRLIALTPRAYQLLGGGSPAMRVRVQVMEPESRRLLLQLQNADAPVAAANADDPPPVKVAAVPRGTVMAESLPPPPGLRSGGGRAAQCAPAPRSATVTPGADPIPLRLPEQLSRVSPHPGPLYVLVGEFGGLQYAELMRARLAQLGAQTSTSYDAPRDRAYRVRIGPLPSVATADAVLDRALRAGVADARIVAE